MDSWIEPMIERSGAAAAPPDARAWIRITEPYPDTPLMHAVAHTYTSDDLPTEAVEYAHPIESPDYDDPDVVRPFFGASLITPCGSTTFVPLPTGPSMISGRVAFGVAGATPPVSCGIPMAPTSPRSPRKFSCGSPARLRRHDLHPAATSGSCRSSRSRGSDLSHRSRGSDRPPQA